MLDGFDALVQSLGPWGVVLLGLAALLEYVLPPFPGDTVTLLGGAYAARGDHRVAVVLASLMVFSLIGMAVTWWLGRVFGRRLDARAEGTLVFGITHEQIRRAQTAMRERGTWLLVTNRFLPSFRAVVFFAAGASGAPLSRVLVLGGLSALAWNSVLLFVGAGIGAHADALEAWLSRYRAFALGVVALVLVVVLVRAVVRRR